MTHQEAIKVVREFGLHHAIGDLPNSTLTVKAFEMAILSLEKQMPKKPMQRFRSKKRFYYACPNCQAWQFSQENHCYECGQFIDWSN